MGLAIGKSGSSIKKAMEVMGKRIEVVEYAQNPEQFIKNCFLPAKVTSVVFEGEGETQVAQVEVRDEDRGPCDRQGREEYLQSEEARPAPA